MKKQKLKLFTTIFLTSAMLLNTGSMAAIAYTEGQINVESREAFDVESFLGTSEELTLSPRISPDIDTAKKELVNIIVEFNTAPLAVANAGNKISQYSDNLRGEIEAEHESFKNQLTQKVRANNTDDAGASKIEFNEEYFYAFNGIAMTMPADEVESLLELPEVSKVWKDREVKLPEPSEEDTVTPMMTMESFPQIGVDRLHDEGINGDGIKVGVLDTGIDYNHPDLKDVYKGGYDFVNKDNDPMETTYQDWKNDKYASEYINGSAYYTSHGTHVAGTIAGQAKNEGNVKALGVAPGVELYAYKVLGKYGSGDTSWVIAGIDKAVQDGMDVINLSLGSSVNNSLDPSSIAINNAAKAGVIPVVAAGNSGPNDYTVGSPGVSPLAITVGASNTSINLPIFSGVTTENSSINFKLLANNYNYNLQELKDKELEIVNCGIGKPTDFEGKELTGKIALIQRGEIAFVQKIANAKKAGAELVFIYNNLDGYINTYLDTSFDFIPTFNLTKADGEALVNNLDTNNVFTFKEISSEIQKGDILADFSSKGPVANSSEIKPDIVAPGVNILSTYPEYIHHPQEGEDYSTAYNKISGTSMATPHVAGVVALMLSEARKDGEDLSVSDVKTILMNTADELNGDYSVYEKGAGRVNAYEAVKDSVTFKVKNTTKTIENDEVVEIETISGALQFGSVYNVGNDITVDKTIAVVNNSNEDKTFNLSVFHTKPEGLILDSTENGVKLNTPEEITVPAGQSVEVPLSLIIPENAQYGFYEGILKFSNTNNSKEDYVIPYAVRYSEKGIKVFELTRNTVANDVDFWHEYYNPTLGYAMVFNNPMNTLKVYLKDAETGERIGIINDYKEISVVPDMEYIQFPAFSGKYLPMVGDYVENRVAVAEEGHYKLEMVTTDEDGNVYTAEQHLFIDNTPPEIILEEGKDFGLHEISEEDFTVENGIKAYYVKGRIYNDTVDKLHELGYTHDMFGDPINQQSNGLLYYQQLPNERSPWYSGTLNIDSEGNFSIGVLPEEIENNPTEVSLFGYDYARAGDYDYEKYSAFIKAGEAYGDITYDKEKVVLGDTQTGHVNFKNMKDVTNLEFVIGFSKKVYDLESITINPEFKKYVESQGAEVKVTHEPTSDRNIEDLSGEPHKVVVEISGSNNGIDINEKMPVVDINAKVVNDNEHYGYSHLFYSKTNSKNKYTDASGNVNQLYIMSYMNWYKFMTQTTSSNLNYISAQGFFRENGSAKRLDYTKVGAKAYIITPDGKRYDAAINSMGWAEASVPANIEYGEFYVEVPGHFRNKMKVQLGQRFDGDVVGVLRVDRILTAYAGDINGDDIIDDKDKEILSADLGKTTTTADNYLASDINKDCVVDNLDMAYITKNFGMVNPRVIEDAKVAVATLKVNQGLKDLLVAVNKINLLPESDKKQELLNEMKEAVKPIHLKIATEAVEKAEATETQADVDLAKAIVNELPDSEAKNSLVERLNKVQEAIDLAIAIEEATKAIEKAEITKNKDDIKTAEKLVKALPKGEVKDGLFERVKSISKK